MTDTDSNEASPSRSTTQQLNEDVAGSSSDMISALGQFYRGEMERAVGWRRRLDQTTNWAVVLMAAIITFTFSSEDNPHYVLLIGVLGVVAFLLIESQRFQEYDVWRYRVRLLQRQFFADVADPDRASESEWRTEIGENLRRPSLTISRLQAMGHRLKHVYIYLLSVLIATWILRITAFESDTGWQQSASIGDVPGTVVAGVVLAVYVVLVGLALWSVADNRMREFSDDTIEDSE